MPRKASPKKKPNLKSKAEVRRILDEMRVKPFGGARTLKQGMSKLCTKKKAAPRKKAAKKAAPRRRAPKPTPWWGAGPHPLAAGVTIDIPCRWSTARKRWESPDGRYYFDEKAADKAAEFFPALLRHHIGEWDGQPFHLLPYQEYATRAVFGWKRADGHRRFRKLFVAVPKGSGKSPWASGLGLYLTYFDDEPGAEVYAAAADKDQARIVFNTSRIMVERSEELSKVFEVFRNSITVRDGTEYCQVLSSDAPTKHGLRPHGIVFDELHTQPDRRLFDTLYRGMGKRRQPLLVMLTTAGDDDESICFEEWEYARRLIKGEIEDDIYFPVIFEASAEDDWTSPEVWKRVNPGYGVTVKADYFEQECLAAQNEPRKLNSFLQLHTNRWVNQAVAWIPVDWWDACKAARPSDADLGQLVCAAGIDMAQKIDLTAFVLTFREPLQDAVEGEVVTEEGEKLPVSLNYRVHVVPFFWLPEETVRDREREGFLSFRSWAAAGQLTITEGAIIDYDQVFTDITKKIAPRFPLLKAGEIGYDPAFATELALKLQGAGFQVVEVLQNYKHLSEPSQIFEALVKARRLHHDGHRLLRWNVENVAIRQDDAGRIRPCKPKKSAKKIDGVIASIMGLSRLIAQPVMIDQSYTIERLA